jgi:gas vesicle protein
MESSNELCPIFDNNLNYCQNPFQVPPCHARQYLMCPHCSFHLCFQHGQQHQEQIQHEANFLHNQSKNLEKTLNEYEIVETIVQQVFNSLNEWKQKMYQFIDEYTQQIKIHIEQAQNRLNEQWYITKNEYLQMLENFVIEPIDRLLKSILLK